MHPRIEKSGFRTGEYVGYCDGVWRIRKQGDSWEASQQGLGVGYFRASTLEGIGKGLDERANIAVGRMLFRS